MDKETKQEFNKVQAQFTKVNGEFKKVDDQFKRVDEQFKRVDARFDKMEKEAKEEFNRLENLLDFVAATVMEHSVKLERLDVIEQKIDNLPTRQEFHEMLTHIDSLMGKGQKLEQEDTMHTAAIRRLTDTADRHEKEINKIKKHVALK